VVTSNVSSLPEGPATRRAVNPENVFEIAAAQGMLLDEDLRRRLIAKVGPGCRFSWSAPPAVLEYTGSGEHPRPVNP